MGGVSIGHSSNGMHYALEKLERKQKRAAEKCCPKEARGSQLANRQKQGGFAWEELLWSLS